MQAKGSSIGLAAPAIVLLAGGEGRRIGGGKPHRRLGGKALIAHVLPRARLWSDAVAVAVREGAGELAAETDILLDDPGIAGPLGGLAAALRHGAAIGRETVLTLPCDTPFLPDDLPGRLASALAEKCAALAASGGNLHPTCALWLTGAEESLEGYLATGRQSLRGFAEHVGHGVAEWPAEPIDPFFNVNDAMDLATAEAWLAGNA